jgi:hypothetical protein
MASVRYPNHLRRCVACWLLLAGCASLQPTVTPDMPTLPSLKQVRVGRYVFITDFDLKRDHPLLRELEALQDQVYAELQLPTGTNIVQVYLFADRQDYEQYMQAHFRNLPTRRAFFMARSDERHGDELLVYTYWGDRIQEDLRHELTHALLHSVLKNVPMWLDEGLAEYFEVPPHWQGLNHRHLAVLRVQQPGVPWTPNLARLEKLTLIKEMTPADYRESWAWVHFMLRSPSHSQAKGVLLQYLQRLRATHDAGPLEPLLAGVVSSPETALRQHLSQLEEATRSLAALREAPPKP